jgi:transposase-like protein
MLPAVLERLEHQLSESLRQECPRCCSNHIVRNGHNTFGRQRYKCMNCLAYYTSHGRGKPRFYHQIALQLYLEGLGFRAIGRMLGVSNVTVLCWIRTYGKQIERPANTTPEWPQIVELDEVWTYIASKKKDA